MTGYQVMPRLAADEYAELEASIVEDGVQVPITVALDGTIVDGHHRDEIARKHNLHCPRVVTEGCPEKLRGLAFSLNLHRRHLTREQKRDLVAESIKADPQLSDREHGRRTGVDHKTAGGVRDELESGGEIPHLERRDNPQGRSQPASKPPKSDVPQPDPENAEIVCRDCDGAGCESCFPADDSDERDVDPTPDPVAPKPKKPKPKSSGDSRPDLIVLARNLGLDIAAITNRVEKLGADDRLAGKKNEVAPKLRHHLEQLIQVCQDLNQQLTPGV